ASPNSPNSYKYEMNVLCAYVLNRPTHASGPKPTRLLTISPSKYASMYWLQTYSRPENNRLSSIVKCSAGFMSDAPLSSTVPRSANRSCTRMPTPTNTNTVTTARNTNTVARCFGMNFSKSFEIARDDAGTAAASSAVR